MFGKILSFVSLGVLLVQCGLKDPGTEVSKNLRKIKRPNYSQFHLSLNKNMAAGEKVSFEGSLLLWKNLAENQKALTNILGLSVASKEVMAKVKTLSNEKDKVVNEIALTETLLKKKPSQGVEDFSKEIDSQNFALELNALVPEAKRETEEFKLFCDAQYMDFTTSTLLTHNTYTSRPSPSVVCEDYYMSRSYFDREECDASEQAKSYLSCYWSPEFLTRSNLKVTEKTEAGKVEISDDKLLSEEFLKNWNQQDWKQALLTGKRLLMAGLLKFDDGSRYYLNFDHDRIKVKEHLDYDLGETVLALSSRSLSSVEGDACSFSDLFVNFIHLNPLEKSLNYYLNKEDELVLEGLTKGSTNLFPSSFISFDRENDDNALKLEELNDKFKEMEKEDSKYSQDVAESNKELTTKIDEFDKLLFTSDITHAFYSSMNLNIITNEKGALELSFTLDGENGAKIFSCALRSSSSRATVGDENSLDACSYDKNSGELKFSLTGKKLQDAGWELKKKETKGASFNNIDKEDLLESKIDFELAYILYKGLIPMLTGDVFIKNGNKVVHQGSILLKDF